MSMRELRNNGAAILGRVNRGESLTITRDGAPVAELSPLRQVSPSVAELIARRKNLPRVDIQQMRCDIDKVMDPSL